MFLSSLENCQLRARRCQMVLVVIIVLLFFKLEKRLLRLLFQLKLCQNQILQLQRLQSRLQAVTQSAEEDGGIDNSKYTDFWLRLFFHVSRLNRIMRSYIEL